MSTAIIYDPSISSLNLGDRVISLSCRSVLEPFLSERYVVEFSSHLPIPRLFMSHFRDPGYKFLLGSNLLMSEMNHRFRQWDVTLLNAGSVGPVISMGVGWHQYAQPVNRYTARLYRKLFGHDLVNSVRDDYTAQMLASAGVENVVNTACPTLWCLTPSHCRALPSEKGAAVVCTLTDYDPNLARDRHILDVLMRSYEQVYLWPQGEGDPTYFNDVGIPEGVSVIAPSLSAYDSVLTTVRPDYLGTRLHGGIRALQHGLRSLIVAIDNRATELGRSVRLPVVSLGQLDELEDILNSPYRADIELPSLAIAQWLGQFGLRIDEEGTPRS